jgi:predicted negative regulator of RcsB-dependent stress response
MGWFWKGKALLALGKNKEAAEAWKKGSETPDGSEKQNEFKELCRKLLL